MSVARVAVRLATGISIDVGESTLRPPGVSLLYLRKTVARVSVCDRRGIGVDLAFSVGDRVERRGGYRAEGWESDDLQSAI